MPRRRNSTVDKLIVAVVWALSLVVSITAITKLCDIISRSDSILSMVVASVTVYIVIALTTVVSYLFILEIVNS